MSMRRDGYTYIGHNGGVAGYAASMYFNRQMQLGVVVLRNVIGGKQRPDRLAVDILESLATAREAEIQADIDARFKAQRAATGSESALRRIIEELRQGAFKYDVLDVELARQLRRRVRGEQAALVTLGPLKSLTFKRVGPAGPNIYEATFENGVEEWRIWLNPEGRVDYFTHRPLPAPR
jgi:hypothetical protein